MDETIVQFIPELIRRYNDQYNENVKIDDITEWNLEKPFRGVAPNIFSQIGFFRYLKPYPKVLMNIFRLLDRDYPVYIITNPCGNSNTAKEKYEWVKYNMPWFPINNVIMISDKSLINDINAFLIDDAPHYLETWKGKTIAIDRLYNKNITSDYRIYNNDFSEVFDIMSKFNGTKC